ncbi:MAG: hypothetical protein FGM40_06850 [Rhodocyclaceae bacterium]|nr:hypothetical protein [Rhodocyclaceae bacterium]
MTIHYLIRFLLVTLLTAAAFVLADTAQRSVLAPIDLGVDNPYLPAGLRVLAVVVFGASGACGLVLGALLIVPDVFPGSSPAVMLLTALFNGVVPLVSLALTRRLFGIGERFEEFSYRALLILLALQSALSPLVHQLWFRFTGIAPASVYNFTAMVVGDIVGSMLMLLAIALAWELWKFARR